MRSFREFVTGQTVEKKIHEVAALMVEHGVDPWQFVLDWHRDDLRMRTAILHAMSEQEELSEGWKDKIGQYFSGIGNALAGNANYTGQQKALAAKAQQASGVLNNAVKVMTEYIKLYGNGGVYQQDMQYPQVQQYVQQLNTFLQYLRQQETKMTYPAMAQAGWSAGGSGMQPAGGSGVGAGGQPDQKAVQAYQMYANMLNAGRDPKDIMAAFQKKFGWDQAQAGQAMKAMAAAQKSGNGQNVTPYHKIVSMWTGNKRTGGKPASDAEVLKFVTDKLAGGDAAKGQEIFRQAKDMRLHKMMMAARQLAASGKAPADIQKELETNFGTENVADVMTGHTGYNPKQERVFQTIAKGFRKKMAEPALVAALAKRPEFGFKSAADAQAMVDAYKKRHGIP